MHYTIYVLGVIFQVAAVPCVHTYLSLIHFFKNVISSHACVARVRYEKKYDTWYLYDVILGATAVHACAVSFFFFKK